MKITEILKPDFVIADLKGKNKESVLEELTGFLETTGTIKNRQAFYNALMEREMLGSTGIGENVAIPHAKSDEVEAITTLFGRSVEGLEFDSLDQKPVHFVCMVIAPFTSTGQHLKALARISRLFKSQGLRDDILKAHDSKEIYSIIVNEDSKFI
ncbi:MAG: PTS fructose transporter subunit IIA [Nitrospinae bacterium CG11_big_fil_rev_8_21_14_0_20_56_8]|nr:MAG: PTS fructose transporter subunit IIA [Nitrospinae bacterium CG11_big_fil_rev_8_21_14_0_20_56_8]